MARGKFEYIHGDLMVPCFIEETVCLRSEVRRQQECINRLKRELAIAREAWNVLYEETEHTKNAKVS